MSNSDDLNKALGDILAALLKRQERTIVCGDVAGAGVKDQPGLGNRREFTPHEPPMLPTRAIHFRPPIMSPAPVKSEDKKD